jgi:hypothetical protein
MTTVIFVHGTGVREPAFTRLFDFVRRTLLDRLDRIEVMPCYWGGEAGARLWHQGRSVPDHDTTRTIDPETSIEEALWSVLYQDPLWELRVLASDEGVGRNEFIPGRLLPGEEFDEMVRGLEVSDKLADALAAAQIADVFESARLQVIGDSSYRGALSNAGDDLGAIRMAVARAIVSEALNRIDESSEHASGITPHGYYRDRVVNSLIDAFGGTDMGLRTAAAAPVRGLALRMATKRLCRRRGALMDATHPFAGDILLYQARGERIRSLLAERINAAGREPVVLLAHSLGGIAAVDLLVSRPLPSVQTLVTVGSQAPFLYEIGALWSLQPHEALPDHVPPWLNIYDPRDMLSFVGAQVFSGRVEDVSVDNGQPFPQAHSAYWTNSSVWDAIAARLR